MIQICYYHRKVFAVFLAKTHFRLQNETLRAGYHLSSIIFYWYECSTTTQVTISADKGLILAAKLPSLINSSLISMTHLSLVIPKMPIMVAVAPDILFRVDPR